MNIIEQMLSGDMEMENFIHILHTDTKLQNQVRALIPKEAINNVDHLLWTKIDYEALRQHDFDLISHLSWICKYNGTIADNLNIWSTIKTLYTYHNPDLVCTNIYEESFALYLNIIQDCYDGPEVEHIVESIIRNALQQKTKKLRTATAKQDVQRIFHLKGRQRPYWIQGPEWPMGVQSPMKFIARKRVGELMQYCFMDVDTGESRIVEQFY